MKLSDNQLKNKIVLVTGASRGIGKSASMMYASLGAKVILLGRDLKSLEQVYDEIIKLKYSEPMISLMDLEKADANDYQELYDNMMNEFGKLDGLLLNASILGDRSPIAHYDSETWVRTLHVNVTTQFLLTKTLLPVLYESDSASVIFLLSSDMSQTYFSINSSGCFNFISSSYGYASFLIFVLVAPGLIQLNRIVDWSSCSALKICDNASTPNFETE